jgi:hypothetical protein
MIGQREVIALLDTGSECSIMSEELFNSLTNSGMSVLHIPVVNSTAFGKKSSRIKKQALIDFKLGEELYEMSVIVAPDVATDFLLGVDFMNKYGVNLKFSEDEFEITHKGVVRRHAFHGAVKKQLTAVGGTRPRVGSSKREVNLPASIREQLSVPQSGEHLEGERIAIVRSKYE